MKSLASEPGLGLKCCFFTITYCCNNSRLLLGNNQKLYLKIHLFSNDGIVFIYYAGQQYATKDQLSSLIEELKEASCSSHKNYKCRKCRYKFSCMLKSKPIRCKKS